MPVLAESLPVNTVNHPENVLNGQTGLCSDFSYSTARTGPFIGGGGGDRGQGRPLRNHLVLQADAVS